MRSFELMVADKEKIDLNDLPKWSLWPSRLLGLAPWEVPVRNIDKIDKEYDKDKYAKNLEYFLQSQMRLTPEDIKQYELGLGFDQAEYICVSIGDELFKCTLSEAKLMYYKILVKSVEEEIKQCRTVVELGSGYGFNLWKLQQYYPEQLFVGGEYSKNAIELAQKLYSDNSGIQVTFFNFYDEGTYKILSEVEPPILIFTSHALEQLPRSAVFFDNILRYRDKIKAVFHFEPIYQLHDDQSLLGLMRRRYTHINDYNVDLLSELRTRPDIRIIAIEANLLGINPLNPVSVIHWSWSL